MDVVVIGGGPAGAVAAITLRGRGHRVRVLEASLAPQTKLGECLSPGSNKLLEQLGLRAQMQATGHLPAQGNRAYWGGPEASERHFLFGTKGEGWHLDRRRFEADLAARAQAAGVVWSTGVRLHAIEREGSRWRLHVDERAGAGATELGAGFVIDASGRARALVRRLPEAKSLAAPLSDGSSDRLFGVAASYELAQGSAPGLEDCFSVVEATARGWCYSARLASGRLVVVAMSDVDLLAKHERLATLLADAPRTRARIDAHGGALLRAPTTHAAGGSRLARAYGQGWLAVGDAALAFDPLSSYGITSAMGTAYYAAHALADSLAGETRGLPVYQGVLEQTWGRYLEEHGEHYAAERRWPGQPFWARRQAGADA